MHKKNMDADPTGRAVLGPGSVDARLLGLRVGISPRAWMRVSVVRDLCVGLITRLEDSYRMWCVIVKPR